MSERWKVAHTFEPPIRLLRDERSDVAGLTFHLDGDALHSVVHLLEMPPGSSRQEVSTTSRRLIEGAVVAIRYLQVGPVHWWTEADRVNPPENGLRLIARATASIGTRAVCLPTTGWSGELGEHISAWLTLAAQARESQSASIRLRLYFLVLEDLKLSGLLHEAELILYSELKAVRDFVSHPKITNSKTRATLLRVAPSLAGSDGEFRYSPRDARQQETILQFADQAARTVDKRLLAELGVPSNYWGADDPE